MEGREEGREEVGEGGEGEPLGIRQPAKRVPDESGGGLLLEAPDECRQRRLRQPLRRRLWHVLCSKARGSMGWEGTGREGKPLAKAVFSAASPSACTFTLELFSAVA